MNKNNFIIVAIVILCIVIGGVLFWQNLGAAQEEVETELKSEEFKVIKRIPEGTQSGWFDEEKAVHSPLRQISVVFNNDVDENTLTLDNFYALWGLDDKVPGIIKYNKRTKTASLIFYNDLIVDENTSKIVGTIIGITVIVENVKNLNGKKVEELLYSVHIIK